MQLCPDIPPLRSLYDHQITPLHPHVAFDWLWIPRGWNGNFERIEVEVGRSAKSFRPVSRQAIRPKGPAPRLDSALHIRAFQNYLNPVWKKCTLLAPEWSSSKST